MAKAWKKRMTHKEHASNGGKDAHADVLACLTTPQSRLNLQLTQDASRKCPAITNWGASLNSPWHPATDWTRCSAR
eukprot:4003524-Amphidinium_carterae.1